MKTNKWLADKDDQLINKKSANVSVNINVSVKKKKLKLATIGKSGYNKKDMSENTKSETYLAKKKVI